jgi:hypothetical protein
MPVFKNILVLFCLLSFTAGAMAQKPKPKPSSTQKFVLPKLKTSLGSRSDSIITVSVDEAIQLVNQPLSVTDAKKAVYTISSYQCMYKRKGVTEDEVSGKVTPITSPVANSFKTTPLSAIWIKTISEQLKAGEEIFFFDIVVKNTEGRLMFAPNLKLVVQ